MSVRGRAVVDEDIARILSAAPSLAAFAGLRILVTGATGFVPSYLIEAILGHNERHPTARARVLGLVRNEAKARKRFERYGGRDDLEIVVHDLERPLPRGAIAGPVDIVVHAASPASPTSFGSDPIGTLGPNVFGTRDLLELAEAKQSTGFVFVSSGEIYGSVSRELIRETDYGVVDPFAVRSCYAEGKRMGETLCAAFQHQRGVPCRVARLFHTYGPGMPLRDGRVFSDFVADIVAGHDIVMRSDGSAVRPYCYLADATLGLLTVMIDGLNGEAYNVGNSGAVISVKGLAELLCELFPPRRIATTSVTPTGYLVSPITRNAPDTTKLEGLGWRPTTSIREGFERTVESYQ